MPPDLNDVLIENGNGNKVKRLEAELELLKSELEKARELISSQTKSFGERDSTITNLRGEKKDLDAKLTAAQTRIDELVIKTATIPELEKKLKLAEEDKEKLKADLEREKLNSERTQAALEELRGDVKTAKDALEAEKKKKAPAGTLGIGIANELGDLNEKIGKLTKERDELKNKLQEAEEANEGLQKIHDEYLDSIKDGLQGAFEKELKKFQEKHPETTANPDEPNDETEEPKRFWSRLPSWRQALIAVLVILVIALIIWRVIDYAKANNPRALALAKQALDQASEFPQGTGATTNASTNTVSAVVPAVVTAVAPVVPQAVTPTIPVMQIESSAQLGATQVMAKLTSTIPFGTPSASGNGIAFTSIGSVVNINVTSTNVMNQPPVGSSEKKVTKCATEACHPECDVSDIQRDGHKETVIVYPGEPRTIPCPSDLQMYYKWFDHLEIYTTRCLQEAPRPVSPGNIGQYRFISFHTPPGSNRKVEVWFERVPKDAPPPSWYR